MKKLVNMQKYDNKDSVIFSIEMHVFPKTNYHLFHIVFSKSRLPNFEHQQEQQISRAKNAKL